MAHAHSQDQYYLPHPSYWPLLGSIGVATMMVGGALWLNDAAHGRFVLMTGAVVLLIMLFGWFGTVISESQSGVYNRQVSRSFRWGMAWFIFSEVMFFGAFFFALFFARVFELSWLDGEGGGVLTNFFLWNGYEGVWPNTANGPAGLGGNFEPMQAWGVPAINTAILLSSGVTVTWAQWALKANRRGQLILGLFATVALGVTFLTLQAIEYTDASHELNLTLGSGIYGSTFFMLTGFHGLHVTLGAIMLTVILLRCMSGHFTPEHHFGFEGVAWYWHFVDVVWLCLFIFVYWL
jgi:cytochrome c oxidase subunit III